MQLPAPILTALAAQLPRGEILHAVPVAGGSIHHAARVTCREGELFVKYGRGEEIAFSLASEARGLRALRRLDGVRAPAPELGAAEDGWTFLALPWITQGRRTTGGHETGALVATLHVHRAPHYGDIEDNAIGTLTQRNEPYACGRQLWADLRLDGPARVAHARGGLGSSDRDAVHALASRMRAATFPEPMPPVWLHGDLWAGNICIDDHDRTWLIDPAVYAGDPRVDLAMTRLFGGFDQRFYAAWKARHGARDDDHLYDQVYTIYPLLVHAALFGGGYGARAGALSRAVLADV